MKILLLGDYSALFLNLKQGLEALGHEVLLVSSGDAWKQIPADIHLGLKHPNPKIEYLNRVFWKSFPSFYGKYFQEFDVVQLINTSYFFHPIFKHKQFYLNLAKNNEKFFISASGDDAYFWKFGRQRLKYGPFDDFLKYDKKSTSYYLESAHALECNQFILSLSNGIIPIMYEYEASYRHSDKLLNTIPIGINTDEIKYKENNISNNKLVIFHGLNRYGFKGTHHIEEAFSILHKKYPNDLELIIDGKMPLDAYLNIMAKTNIVIDQVNSYSLGVNGIYALAMGKIVMGGAEPESLRSLGIKSSPVINVLPSANDIVSKIEFLLENKHKIPELGQKARNFALENHNYIKVAERYINTWTAN